MWIVAQHMNTSWPQYCRLEVHVVGVPTQDIMLGLGSVFLKVDWKVRTVMLWLALPDHSKAGVSLFELGDEFEELWPCHFSGYSRFKIINQTSFEKLETR